ncbi:uncharacterized protein LOC141649774 [Silene latifolia]|uniref:uncharacterized protein LOC141649774 n=1 Tax=Silene latifolia TaxID=37657 RepID=UPI003D786B80
MSQEEVDRLIATNKALTAALEAKGSAVDLSKMSAKILRHNPTKYDGLGEPSLLGEWCREFDNIFELMGCPEELQVDQAAFYLRAKAGLWWTCPNEAIKEAAANNGNDYVKWKGFKKILMTTFVPEYIRSRIRAEFDSFMMMDDMTVETYHNRFMELAEYVDDLNFTPEMLSLRFEKGLTTNIKKRLADGEPKNMDEIYQRAGYAERIADMLKEEKKEKGEKKKTESISKSARNKKQNTNQFLLYFSNNARSGGVGRGGYGRTEIVGSSGVSCFRCGKLGHKVID